MEGHSILPPSGAAAWVVCPMWATMIREYPQAPTPESLEGDAAHWVARQALASDTVQVGDIAPNGVPVTDEMLEGGELYHDTIVKRAPLTEFAPWEIERRVDLSAIHPECWGTPDFSAYSAFYESVPVIEIVDYKYGHRFVDAFECWQMIAYAIGKLVEVLKVPYGILDGYAKVNLTIVQPRCYVGEPVRTWSIRASELRSYANILRAAATATFNLEPKAVVNPECRDCPGRHACVALQTAGYSDAEFASQSAPVEMTSAAASLELSYLERAAARLAARVTGLREMVTNYARRGEITPWHKLEQGYGRQRWNIPTAQVLAVGQMFNVDLSKPTALTPKQAIKAGIDGAVISAYSETPAGELKLLPATTADARRVFGNT